MNRIRSEYFDADPSSRSIVADVLVREEPDDEDEADNGDEEEDDEDKEDDEGYSE